MAATGIVLHAIEALPGARRYVATFRRADGSEQTAVVEARESTVVVAEASLPPGWGAGTTEHEALSAVVRALDAARSLTASDSQLRDVDGGWDVGLGNVVLEAGVPTCTAHGPMESRANKRYECTVCGAAAQLGF
jgi:hypothetical protein